MPKGKAVSSRRGGGKVAEAETIEGENAAEETNLNNSHATVGKLELVDANESIDEGMDTTLADDKVSSFKSEITTQTLDYSSGLKEKGSESDGTGVEKCLEATDKLSPFEEKLQSKSLNVEDDGSHEVKGFGDSEKTELLITEPGNIEGMDKEVHFVDSDVEDDNKKEKYAQHKDKKAKENQQLVDPTGGSDIYKGNASPGIEFQKHNVTQETGNAVGVKLDCNTAIGDLIKTTEFQHVEEVENSKFDEISEGSIELNELSAELLSSVELTGEFFEPKEVQNNKNDANAHEEKRKVVYKKSEPLEEVLFSTEKEDMKVIADDKDNDEISDTSLSDQENANLSLEEISDDDLEPSKRRRKSPGHTLITDGNEMKGVENTKPDIESAGRSDEMYEKQTAGKTDVKVQKRAASADNTDSKSSSNKRHKPSDDKNDTEEVSSESEKETQFSTDICGDSKQEKKSQTKDLDISYSRNVVLSNRNLSQSFKNVKQESTEGSFSSRRKYELVDASCQSEPRLLKGKIIQCNINPVKSDMEHEQQMKFAESDSAISELLNMFKHKLPSNIPDKVMSDVISLQPTQKRGTYSFSMGPLTLADVLNPDFKDVLSATENFSLVFDSHSQGTFKATFSKPDNITLLLKRLTYQQLSSHSMVVSVLYSCEGEGSNCVWKATLLFVKEQGIQTESQVIAGDDENKARLCLSGVPKGVSTTFIHLLFPEAESVVTDPGAGDGVVILNFSSSKMVEGILSSYGLLIINDSQINIYRMRLPDNQQNVHLPTDVGRESDTLIKETTECEGDQNTDYLTQQKEFANKHERGSSEQQPSQVIQNEIASDFGKDVLTRDVDSLAVNGKESLKEGHKNMESNGSATIGTDSSVTLTSSGEETSVYEMAHTKINSAERTKPKDEAVEIKIAVEDVAVDMSESKKSEDQVVEVMEDIISESARDSTDSGERDGKGKLSIVAVNEEASQLKTSMKNNTGPEMEFLTNKNISALGHETEIPIEKADIFNPEGSIDSRARESLKCKTSGKEVNAVETEASKKVNSENLEDVSDEEMVNNNRLEDSLKKTVLNVDLTNESRDLVKVLNNENVKDLNEKGNQQNDSHYRKGDDIKAEDLSSSGKCVGSKLVMTDGGLEVSMEVIDVNDNEGEPGKILSPSTRRRSQERPIEAMSNFSIRRKNMVARSSRASISGVYYIPQDLSRGSHAEKYNYSESSRKRSPSYMAPVTESTAPRRDSPKLRSRSPLPRTDVDLFLPRQSQSSVPDHLHASGSEQWSKNYESQQPATNEDSRRVGSYTKPVVESRDRPGYVQSSVSASHSPHSRHGDQVKQSGHSSHRDPLERRQNYRKSRSKSISSISESSHNQVPGLRKSPHRRGSPKHPISHASRSPISVSSRSCSLSPVSKSSSLDLPHSGAEKEELTKTVEHFLKIAKGIQQTHKRRHGKRLKSSSSRRSPHYMSRSSFTKRPRSPLPARSRNSRSPLYVKSSRYKYERSLSPISQKDDNKKHDDHSFSDRRSNPYPRESGSSRHCEPGRSQISGNYSYEEQSRSKSGKWPEPKYSEQYRSSGDQPWQQSYGAYQSQSYGPVPTNNIYNPSYPPPGCPPQGVQTGMYSGSPMPAYQYGSQSQYNYSYIPTSIPPPYVQTVPPPAPFSQPYQSANSAFPRF